MASLQTSKTGRKSYYQWNTKGHFWCFPFPTFPQSNCCNQCRLSRRKHPGTKRDLKEGKEMEELLHSWKKWLEKGNKKRWVDSSMEGDSSIRRVRLGSHFFLLSRKQKNLCSNASMSILTSQDLENTTLLEVQVFYPYFSHLRSQRLSSEKWKGRIISALLSTAST